MAIEISENRGWGITVQPLVFKQEEMNISMMGVT